MRTWGFMLNFIPFGWNAVLKYQHLVVGLVLLNTAGPGLFSTSFTSPYKLQDIDEM